MAKSFGAFASLLCQGLFPLLSRKNCMQLCFGHDAGNLTTSFLTKKFPLVCARLMMFTEEA